MVTAIVIPVLILYFYWITKKEKEKRRKQWESLDQVTLEARIQGVIFDMNTLKKHYYHEMYMMVTTIQLQDGDRSIPVVLRQPYTQHWQILDLQSGNAILVEGRWEKDVFLAGRIKKADSR